MMMIMLCKTYSANACRFTVPHTTVPPVLYCLYQLHTAQLKDDSLDCMKKAKSQKPNEDEKLEEKKKRVAEIMEPWGRQLLHACQQHLSTIIGIEGTVGDANAQRQRHTIGTYAFACELLFVLTFVFFRSHRRPADDCDMCSYSGGERGRRDERRINTGSVHQRKHYDAYYHDTDGYAGVAACCRRADYNCTVDDHGRTLPVHA